MNLDVGIRRIPVTQIVEEIAEDEKSHDQVQTVNLNVYFQEIEVFSDMSLYENRPVDPDLCRQSDVLVRIQFDTCACLFSVVS